MLEKQIHTIPPVYDAQSRVLVLGSFPSGASRDAGFFYGHPRNRFWQVMAAVLRTEVPVTVDEKRAMLIHGGVALWDVAASCRIEGASDASICDVVPNDLTPILRTAKIEKIFTNGTAAHRLYVRLLAVGLEDIPLPSTSPANAQFSIERLICVWRKAFEA